MANKSKIKGSAYEAKIKRYLNSHFDIEFERMPLSGSIEYLKGDLWTPHDTAAWPYCIECKHYKDIQWNNLLTAKTTDLLNFWRQAEREAEVMKKKPLLIFRWNPMEGQIRHELLYSGESGPSGRLTGAVCGRPSPS